MEITLELNKHTLEEIIEAAETERIGVPNPEKWTAEPNLPETLENLAEAAKAVHALLTYKRTRVSILHGPPRTKKRKKPRKIPGTMQVGYRSKPQNDDIHVIGHNVFKE